MCSVSFLRIHLIHVKRDGWWFLCSGSLDTDGICISKPPSLDTDDIGCLGNMHGLVCLSPLDAEGAGSVSFLDVVILVLWSIYMGW